MSIIASLGAYVKSLLGSQGPVIDKLDAGHYIDSVIEGANAAQVALASPEVKSALSAVLGGQYGANADANRLKMLYHLFMKGQSGAVNSQEHKGYFAAVALALQVIINDLEAIRAGHSDLFSESGPAQIDAKDLKMSTALLLGYTDVAYKAVSWINDFCIIALDVVSGNPPGKLNYLFADMEASVLQLSMIVGEVLARRSKDTILTIAASLDARGKDAFLSVNGRSIEQYLADQDYNKDELMMVNGFIRNPIVQIGHNYVERRQLRYAKLRDQREFLQGKISLLQRKQIVKDPNDPEVKRLQTIESAYRQELAKTQEKLDRMEKHV